MSYILEALRKIEQKREQEESPKSLTFLRVPGPEAKKRPLWPYPVVVALLLNAGILIWWIGPRWSEQKTTPASHPLPRPSANRTPAAVDQGKFDQPIFRKKILPAKEIPPTHPPLIRKETQEIVNRPPIKLPLPNPPQKTGTAVPVKKEILPAGRLVNWNELPPEIKGALPPSFKVSAHIYDPDPKNRVVRVNDRMLQEGQELAPGLKVEEIIPGGIIFSYKGFRFRIGI
jgi:general secretion pathway protein B